MSDIPDLWLNVGACPVCQCGLLLVRSAMLSENQVELFALCDECEAMWTEPESAPVYPDLEAPACPTSGLPLYGPDTHWATLTELKGTIWEPCISKEDPSQNVEEPTDQDH